MAHGPLVPQNFSSKTILISNDFSGIFDALHQYFLVLFGLPLERCRKGGSWHGSH